MTKKRKNIFDWNHVSDKLTDDQLNELKLYYQTYHRKYWAYKKATKHLKRWKLIGDSLSVCLATGGIASTIATSGVSLIAISTVSILIQTCETQKPRSQDPQLYIRLSKLSASIKHY